MHCNKLPDAADVGNKGSLFEDHCFVRYGGIDICSKLFVRIHLTSNIIRRVGMYVRGRQLALCVKYCKPLSPVRQKREKGRRENRKKKGYCFSAVRLI